MFLTLDKLQFGLLCLDKFPPINPNLKSVISTLASAPHSVSLDRSVPNFISGGISTKEPSLCGLEINLVTLEIEYGFTGSGRSDLECASLVY